MRSKEIGRIIGILWILLLTISLIVFYNSLHFDWKTELFTLITLTFTFLLIFLCYAITTNITLTTAITLAIISLILAFSLGFIVPFLSILMVIATFLFYLAGYVYTGGLYSLLFSLLPLLELITLTPIIQSSEFEVGYANLIILFIVNIVCAYLLKLIMSFYNQFSELSFLGLDNKTIPSLSANYINSLLIKGLYVQLLIHSYNNLLQKSLITGIKPDVVAFLANTQRNRSTKQILLQKIISYLPILTAQTNIVPRIRLSNHDAHILFIILSDITNNYQKSQATWSVDISTSQKLIQFVFTQVTSDSTKRDYYLRNLGNIRHFLKLSNKGTLDIEHRDQLFITHFTYSPSHPS